MTSTTQSALRPSRSKWMRWRSPLPFLLGPGTAAVQLGSHSGMRLASERSVNTSSMGTPTKPEYVSEIGRMVVQSRCAVRGTRLLPVVGDAAVTQVNRRRQPRTAYRAGFSGFQSPNRPPVIVLVPMPLGVTGNTPDSGSGESWFEPRRGNSKRDATMSRVALRAFLGPASVLQAFT